MTLCPTHHHALFHLMHTIIRNLLSALLFAVMLVACGGNAEVQRQLAVADSLISIDPDSALHTLRAIDYKKVDADCDRAYYNLVLNNIKGKTDGWMSLSDIDYCIDYYTRHYNPQRLQRSYYCRGMADEKISKNTKQAIIDYKKAENLFEEAKDSLLQIEIYEKITDAMTIDGSGASWTKYMAKKLALAKTISDINLLALTYNDYAYQFLFYPKKNIDSCFHYVNKALAIIPKCDDQTKYITYKHLAEIYGGFTNNYKQAIRFLQMAEKYKRDDSTDIWASYIYIKAGEIELAEKIADKYITSNSKDNETLALYLKSKIALYRKDYLNAYLYIEKADSVDDISGNIKDVIEINEIQERYDSNKVKENMSIQIYKIVTSALAILLILAIIAIFFFSKSRKKGIIIRKMEKKITLLDLSIEAIEKDKQKSLTEKCNELNVLINEKQTIQKELDKVRQTMSAESVMNKKFVANISEGLKYIYYIINNEENLVIQKNDRINIIECYKLLDEGFVELLDHANDGNMSPQEKLLCIMFRMGKTPAQIKSITSMSDNAYRQAKSRTIRKLREEPKLKTFCDKIIGSTLYNKT